MTGRLSVGNFSTFNRDKKLSSDEPSGTVDAAVQSSPTTTTIEHKSDDKKIITESITRTTFLANNSGRDSPDSEEDSILV